MSTLEHWTGTEPLPQGKTILLEASAGTGKTWQIEGLVVRLVAEYEVPIDRILVITFTNAATAELRDRIRTRLVKARDALRQPEEPEEDPILRALWAPAGDRAKRGILISAALSSFDLAPISTIHGFSQRMLDQLAFESGQEPGLELLADPTAIIQEMVDDEVARLYAVATEDELAVLSDMGWSREALGKVAKAMSQAVAPVVEPVVEPAVELAINGSGVLEPVRVWMAKKAEFRAWLEGVEGRAAVAAVAAELNRKQNKRIKGMQKAITGVHLDALVGWLDGPALRSARTKKATWAKNLQVPNLEKYWVAAPETMTSFEGYPLFERVTALFAEQDALWPTTLVSFARKARAHIDGELVRSGKLTYSAMLSRLAERIAEESGPGRASPLAEAIRSRFDVALVDEFQDTDGAQWPVMRAVFGHPSRRLLIIGDPKQAIYAFRGADVHVYLDAARVADTRATMRTNWRSDQAYVEAMNHLWAEGSRAFDLNDVDYVEVSAPPASEATRIRGLPSSRSGEPRRPFELRWVDGSAFDAGAQHVVTKEIAREGVAQLAAFEAARLLEGNTELFLVRDGETDASWSALRPGDIAVLVRTNRQAEQVRRHLDRLGVPSVSAGRGSVMESPVLGWLSLWLDAVAEPGRDRPARALATTPLFGWTAVDLATAISAADGGSVAKDSEDSQNRAAGAAGAGDPWDRWLRGIHGWAAAWSSRGFVRVFEGALDDFDVVQRLLGSRQGERYATDLRHLVELCHAEERRTRLGPSGLATWLRAACAAAGDGADEAQALRLESDARAVQLVTVHKSKGLEYPVVLLPFGWDERPSKDTAGALEWHGPKAPDAPDASVPHAAAERPAVEQPQAAVRQGQLCFSWDDGAPRDAREPRGLREPEGPSGRGEGEGGEETELRVNLEVPGTDGRALALERSRVEARQEQLRLLYVALTRARHHCIAWLGPLGQDAADADFYALGRIALRERDGAGRPVAAGGAPALPKNTSSNKSEVREQRASDWEAVMGDTEARLALLAETSGGTLGWSVEAPVAPRPPLRLAVQAEAALTARSWPDRRTLITPWEVSSYSAMVAGRTFDASEPQRLDVVRAAAAAPPKGAVRGALTFDDGAGAQVELGEPTARAEGLDAPIPTHELRGGTDVGTWAHAVFEDLDFRRCSSRDARDLAALVADLGARHGVRSTRQHELLAAALPGMLSTPLDGGPAKVPPGFSLRNLEQADRLDELSFDLRLGEGNRWRSHPDAPRGLLNAEGARVALASRAGDRRWGGDPWLRAIVARSVLPEIAGILTGFIDLTFRAEAGAAGSRHRYFVADYKTNRIAPPNQRQDSRQLHYTHPWMAWEMAHHGYHLQALLYTVALHRMLRQRLPDYSYEKHVGGHLYLFLRGMLGPDTPRDDGLALGVYSDRWPASVVLGLDAALSGASTEEVQGIVDDARDEAHSI